MVSRVGRIVTSAAGAGNGCQIQRVVESCNAGDVNRLRIEQCLASENAGALAAGLLIFPGIEQTEDYRRKRGALRTSAQRIVDAYKKVLVGERGRPAGCTVGIKSAGLEIESLRGC